MKNKIKKLSDSKAMYVNYSTEKAEYVIAYLIYWFNPRI